MAVRAIVTPAVRKAFVEVGNCHLECMSATLMFRELEQTTVRGYELFVDDSLKLYCALTRQTDRDAIAREACYDANL